MKLERERQEKIKQNLQGREKELKHQHCDENSSRDDTRAFSISTTSTTPIVVETETSQHSSNIFKSTNLMMDSFEKLWEKANQDVDLAMLSNTSFATSSSRQGMCSLSLSLVL